MEENNSPCKIQDDGNVTFCHAMGKYCQPANAHTKGMVALQLCNLQTGQIRIAGVVYKEKPSSSGILLNSCPWCGESIFAAVESRKSA